MSNVYIFCNDSSKQNTIWLNGGPNLSVTLSDNFYKVGHDNALGTLWHISNAGNEAALMAVKIQCYTSKNATYEVPQTLSYEANSNEITLVSQYDSSDTHSQWLLTSLVDSVSRFTKYTLQCVDETKGIQYLNGLTSSGEIVTCAGSASSATLPSGCYWVVLESSNQFSLQAEA